MTLCGDWVRPEDEPFALVLTCPHCDQIGESGPLPEPVEPMLGIPDDPF